MKFHALTLCLAGILTTGIAWAQDTNTTGDRSTRTQMRTNDEHYREKEFRMQDRTGYYQEPGDATYSYAGERIWIRDVLYPDLQPISQVAAKVSDIDEANLREAAELRAMEGPARTAGWDNAAAVYEHMALDHTRNADMTRTWLVARDFNPPVEPTVTLAADVTPENGVQHLIDEHVTVFNTSLDKLHSETSETVRGLLLVDATTAANHLSILRVLRNDMDLGRHSLSARLEMEMNPEYMASNQQELYAKIDQEDIASLGPFVINPPAPTAVAAAPPPPAPQPEVQAPPPPAPPVAQAPPPPTPAPRTVVTPARRPYRSNVAGRRQTRRRRPAY